MGIGLPPVEFKELRETSGNPDPSGDGNGGGPGRYLRGPVCRRIGKLRPSWPREQEDAEQGRHDGSPAPRPEHFFDLYNCDPRVGRVARRSILILGGSKLSAD